jgi:NADH dehydrogenase
MNSVTPGRKTGPIFITGGTGFVGSHIVQALAPHHDLRLLVRPGSTHSVPPGVETVEGDVVRPETLKGQMDGCSAVIHLVAIIEERKEKTFDNVIRWGTENVIVAAKAAGIGRFIFMSAIGARYDLDYSYHLAKYLAEEDVKQAGFNYTIFRPSVIFGEGDGFISVLANLVARSPITPIVGSGKSRFQPVQVDDVAACFVRAIEDPELTRDKTYELGGGRAYTYQEMIVAIGRTIGRSRPRIHIPTPVMRAVVGATNPLPRALRPPVTTEQLKMLSLDNSTPNSATELLIGRKPIALEDGIGYLRKT